MATARHSPGRLSLVFSYREQLYPFRERGARWGQRVSRSGLRQPLRWRGGNLVAPPVSKCQPIRSASASAVRVTRRFTASMVCQPIRSASASAVHGGSLYVELGEQVSADPVCVSLCGAAERHRLRRRTIVSADPVCVSLCGVVPRDVYHMPVGVSADPVCVSLCGPSKPTSTIRKTCVSRSGLRQPLRLPPFSLTEDGAGIRLHR